MPILSRFHQTTRKGTIWASTRIRVWIPAKLLPSLDTQHRWLCGSTPPSPAVNRDLDVQCEDAAFKAKAAGQGRKCNTGTQPYNNLSELRAQTFICAEGKERVSSSVQDTTGLVFQKTDNVQVTYHLPGAASTSQQPPQDISRPCVTSTLQSQRQSLYHTQATGWALNCHSYVL